MIYFSLQNAPKRTFTLLSCDFGHTNIFMTCIYFHPNETLPGQSKTRACTSTEIKSKWRTALHGIVVTALQGGSEGRGFESHYSDSRVRISSRGRFLPRYWDAMGPVGKLRSESLTQPSFIDTSQRRLWGRCLEYFSNATGTSVPRAWSTPW